jgi:hypothetical protein
MADIMRGTTQGSLKALGSAVEGVKISIFEMTKGPLKEVIDRTTDWIRANEKLIASRVGEFFKTILDNSDRILLWGKRIGIAVGVVFSLIAVLKTLTAVMAAVNLVLAANPIVLITAGVVALGAAIAAAIIYWDELKAVILKFSDVIKAVAIVLALAFAPFLAVPVAIIAHWKPISTFFKDLWGGVVEVFNSSWEKIKGIVSKITGSVSTVTGAAGAVAGFFGFGEEQPQPAAALAAPAAGVFNPLQQFGTTSNIQEAQVVGPEQRAFTSFQETKSSAVVTIQDDTGRAQLTEGELGESVKLQRTGDF